MSDTPETDEAAEMAGNVVTDFNCRDHPKPDDPHPEVVPADLARKLERERDQAIRERDQATEWLNNISTWGGFPSLEQRWELEEFLGRDRPDPSQETCKCKCDHPLGKSNSGVVICLFCRWPKKNQTESHE